MKDIMVLAGNLANSLRSAIKIDFSNPVGVMKLDYIIISPMINFSEKDKFIEFIPVLANYF